MRCMSMECIHPAGSRVSDDADPVLTTGNNWRKSL